MVAKSRVLFWLAAIASCSFSIWLFYPGSMGNDSLSQWYQLNGILPVSDWHPPMIVHIWKLLNMIIQGPAALLVFQLALYWSGLGLLVEAMFDKRSLLVKLSMLTMIGFFPITWFMMASVWKDALMLSTLLFALGLFLKFRVPIRNRTKSVWFIPVVWLFLMLACGVRHNAIIAVIPLVFVMTFDLTSTGHRWVAKVLLSCAVLFSLVFVSRKINQAGVDVHYPYLVNQLVLWNLAGLSIENNEMLIPESAFVHPDSAKIDVLKRYYTNASNNQLVFNSGIINSSVWQDADYGKWFFSNGMEKIISHPNEYVHMRILFLNDLVGNGKWMPYMAYIFETQYWNGDENLGLKSYPMSNQKTLFLLRDYLITRISHLGFYNVIPYLILLCILLMVLFLDVKMEHRPILIGVALSALCYWLPYIIIAPSNDFRYSIWTIEVVVLLVAIMGSSLFSRTRLVK